MNSTTKVGGQDVTVQTPATTFLSNASSPVTATLGPSLSSTVSATTSISPTVTPVPGDPQDSLQPVTAFIIFISSGVGLLLIYVIISYCVRYYRNRQLMTNGRAYRGVLLKRGSQESEAFGSLGSIESAFELNDIPPVTSDSKGNRARI